MRARRRRSVLNTISAAALEVAIMGIFVIIAQPQLRDALFEILQVDTAHVAAQATPDNRSNSASPAASLDRTVQAVMSSPVGQAVENSLAKWLPPTSLSSASNVTRDQPVQNHMAGNSPYEQYESFRVILPTTHQNQPLVQQPNIAYANSAYTNGGLAPALPGTVQQYAMPQYVAPQSFAAQSYVAQNHVAQNHVAQNHVAQNHVAQNHVPTQLTANQWNIASAAQSQHPNVSVNQNSNNWIPTHATETSYRQMVPPPYGTQSMWK